MLVCSSMLKGYVVLLYALDVNSRVNPEYPVRFSWRLRKIRTACLNLSFLRTIRLTITYSGSC